MKILDDIKAVWSGLTQLKYRTIQPDDTAQRPIFVTHKSEDRELTPTERERLIEASRDIERNFSLAGFTIRKHLQSVAFYQFFSNTPDVDFNNKLVGLIEKWKDECDVTGRHSFDDLIYIVERLRLVDGDVALLRTSDNKIQVIEGDRIKNPPDAPVNGRWVHGVRTDEYGKAEEYAIWDRATYGGNLTYQTTLAADNIDLLGYYSRADQVRGISPLAPALRMFNLLEDSLNLALAKAKVEQSVGLVTKLIGDSQLAPSPMSVMEREKGIDTAARETFGKGILHLSLRDGEEASLLTSNNPSSNFLAFAEQVIRLVLASLDVPYSFYDGSATTFFSGRGELEQYLDSVEKKQHATIRMLNRWVRQWLVPNWLLTGQLDIPAGMTLADVENNIGWSGAGLPTWRLLEYSKDAATAIQLGLISPTELIESYGYSPRKNLQDTAEFMTLAKELGIQLPFGTAPKTNIGL